MDNQEQNHQIVTKKTHPESILMHSLQSCDLSQLSSKLPDVAAAVMLKIQHETTLEKAIKSPKMFELAKSIGDEGLIKLLVVVIKAFCDSFNIKENLTPFQITECAYSIVERFKYNSVKDLIMCFKNVKAGKYGQVYNRLDQSVIFDFLSKYEEEKASFLENKHLDFKAQEASNVNAILDALPEQTKQAIKNFTDPTRTPAEKATPAVITESEYRMNLISVLAEAPDSELWEGRRYFMGKGVKDYILLVEAEMKKRGIDPTNPQAA